TLLLTQNLGSRATSALRCYSSHISRVGLSLAVCSSTSCRHNNWRGAPTFSLRTSEMSKYSDWNPPSVFCTNRLLSSPLHAPGENGTALATPKSHSAGTGWYPQH